MDITFIGFHGEKCTVLGFDAKNNRLVCKCTVDGINYWRIGVPIPKWDNNIDYEIPERILQSFISEDSEE